MADIHQTAKQCLIELATHLAFGHQDENLGTWMHVLRDIEPFLAGLPQRALNLHVSVSGLLSAQPGSDRANARTRLQIDVRSYMQHAAAYHHEQIKLKRN